MKWFRKIRWVRKRRARAVAKRLAASVFAELAGKLVIVDVGAQGLGGHIYQPLLDLGLVGRVIGFEPLEDLARQRNEADNRLDIRPFALGNGETGTLYINNLDPTSSLLPLNMEVNRRFQLLFDLRTVSEVQVETVRLDDVVLPEVIDLVKLDVQGYEAIILDNGKSAMSRTLVVATEVEFQEIYTGQPLFGDIFRLLRGLGFRFHDLIGQARLARQSAAEDSPRLAGSTLVWADAVFMNDGGHRQPDLMMRQAAVMAIVFQAMDVAHELLSEHDRLCGTDHARTFARLV